MPEESTRRVEPVDQPDDPSLQSLFETAAESSLLGIVPDFHRVLARHPEVLRRIVSASLGRLPDSALTVRQRELLVLRTARHCKATYEWAHHTRRARERGLTDDDVQAAWDGPDAAGDPCDRSLLAAADELHLDADLSDETWRQLCEHLSVAAALEAVAVVGWFHLVAFLGNAARLEIEPGVDRRFGPPRPGSQADSGWDPAAATGEVPPR